MDFDQIEEGLGSKHEGSRNDEAPLATGANPAFVEMVSNQKFSLLKLQLFICHEVHFSCKRSM